MLKRIAAVCLMLVLLLSSAMAEKIEKSGELRHLITGDVSEFVVGEELDEAREPNATEATIGTDVYLYVDPYTATYLTFIVVTETGRPLPGVAIYLTYAGVTEFYGMTDENGQFSTYIFRNTPYEFTVSKPGYRTEKGEFCAPEETETIKIVMRKYRKFDFIVLEDGEPAPGIKVMFNGKELLTDENGSVRFWEVNGTYDVEIMLPDGTIKTVTVRIEGDTIYVIDIGKGVWPEEMPQDTLEAGAGLGDLFIVYDKYYRPEDYDLTEQVYTDEEILPLMDAELSDEEKQAAAAAYHAENEDHLHIVAEPDKIQHENKPDEIVLDENGEPLYSQRSLILSGRQLLQIEEQEMESILFENEDLGVWFDISDLYSENMARLFCMIEAAHAEPREHDDWYIEGEFEVGQFDGKYEELPDVWRWVDPIEESTTAEHVLLRETFADSRLEVRITPVLYEEIERAVLGEVENINRDVLKERIRNLLIISDEMKQNWLNDYLADGHLSDTEYAEIKQLCVHGRAYRVQVFLRIDGTPINVTQMLPSLEVRMDVNEDALAEAEEYAAEQLLNETNEKDEQTLVQEYLTGVYDGVHELFGVRNEGAQIEWRDYEMGMALFGAPAAITDGVTENEQFLQALNARLVDIYDVDVRHEPFAFDKNEGFRYYSEVKCAHDVNVPVEQDWQLRWKSDLSGLYLVREVGCDCVTVEETEE